MGNINNKREFSSSNRPIAHANADSNRKVQKSQQKNESSIFTFIKGILTGEPSNEDNTQYSKFGPRGRISAETKASSSQSKNG